jgi:dolichol-phosphate mannosyltransferase
MSNNSSVLFSIIIPIFNENENINRTVLGIEEVFENYKNKYEIIFVDSNSIDGSQEEIFRISKIKPFVKMLQQGKKEGLGAASKFGYSHAIGKYIMQIDGDLAQNPKDLIFMYEYLVRQNCDMVIGSRYINGGKQEGKSILRDFGSRFMNIFASRILKINLRDFTHTFRVFNREIYLDLRNKLIEKGHPSFFIEFTFLTLKNNFKISEYPVIYSDKNNSKESKISIIQEAPRYMLTVIRIFLNNLKNS